MAKRQSGVRPQTRSTPVRRRGSRLTSIVKNPHAITGICALVALLDGFDLQAAAYAASGVVATWHIQPAFLGMILSASLFGVFIGALVISPLADRVGRKRMILVSALLFGGFSCGAAAAPTPETFLIFRMLTGIGLGGAMPSLIAFVSEAAPQHARGRFVTAMFVGLPTGSFIGGLVAGPLMETLGWRSIFWIGGAIPLLLLPFLAWLLPGDAKRAKSADDVDLRRRFHELRALFEGGRTRMTLLLWLAFFMNLLMMHVLSAWLPTLLKTSGMSARESLIAASLYHFGGIVGGLTLGQTIDHRNPFKLLVLMYAAGCLLIAGAAYSAHDFYTFLPFGIAVGVCNIGAQVLLNAVAALVYPSDVRATGVGWALGIGRWGSIFGPMLVGVLVAAGWSTQQIVLGVMGPMLIAAFAMFLQPRRAVEAARAHVPHA